MNPLVVSPFFSGASVLIVLCSFALSMAIVVTTVASLLSSNLRAALFLAAFSATKVPPDPLLTPRTNANLDKSRKALAPSPTCSISFAEISIYTMHLASLDSAPPGTEDATIMTCVVNFRAFDFMSLSELRRLYTSHLLRFLSPTHQKSPQPPKRHVSSDIWAPQSLMLVCLNILKLWLSSVVSSPATISVSSPTNRSPLCSSVASSAIFLVFCGMVFYQLLLQLLTPTTVVSLDYQLSRPPVSLARYSKWRIFVLGSCSLFIRNHLSLSTISQRCQVATQSRPVTSTLIFLPAIFKPHDMDELTLDYFFSQAPRMLALSPLGIICPLHPWIACQWWKARNALAFDNRYFSEAEVVLKGISGAKAWQDAQPLHHSTPQVHQTRLIPSPSAVSSPTIGFADATWHDLGDAVVVQGSAQCSGPRPSSTTPTVFPITPQPILPAHTVTCFVDAAWQASSSHCGLGWCFLDPRSSYEFQGSATHLHISYALVGEAIALKTAIQAALCLEFTHLTVCSDSKSLVTLLNTKGDLNELRSVLFDIRRLCETFSSISFSFIPRLANVVADGLAKAALYSIDSV